MKELLHTIFAVSSLCLLTPMALSFGQTQDDCDPVLKVENISSRSNQELVEKALADSFCDDKTSIDTSSQYRDAEAAYKVVSGSFKDGATTYKEYRSKYCKDSKSSFK